MLFSLMPCVYDSMVYILRDFSRRSRKNIIQFSGAKKYLKNCMGFFNIFSRPTGESSKNVNRVVHAWFSSYKTILNSNF